MNKEILIKDDKVLKLNNIIARPLLEDDEEMQKTLQMMDGYIKANQLDTFGPMIMYTGLENLAVMTNPKISIKIMFQISNIDKEIKAPFERINAIKIGPCMYARFIGNEEDLGIAQSKIQVYAYEHDILLKPETYMIFVDKKEEESIIDIFVPIDSRV